MTDIRDATPLPSAEVAHTVEPPERALRRPGELVFTLLMLGFSAVLAWSAFRISGFAELSAPGTVPMVTTAVMVATAAIVLLQAARRPADATESVARHILPRNVLLIVAMLGAYALALRPLGFLPSSALFLVLAIRVLSGRSWGFALLTGLASLVLIYVVFRVVFVVLMPPGIVPEGEMLHWFRTLGGLA